MLFLSQMIILVKLEGQLLSSIHVRNLIISNRDNKIKDAIQSSMFAPIIINPVA